MDYEFRPGDLAMVSDKNGIIKEFRGLMCRIVDVASSYGLAKVVFDVDPRGKLEGTYTASLNSLTPILPECAAECVSNFLDEM